MNRGQSVYEKGPLFRRREGRQRNGLDWRRRYWRSARRQLYLHLADFALRQFGMQGRLYVLAAIICAVSLVAQSMNEGKLSADAHGTVNAPTKFGSARLVSKDVFVPSPSPNVGETIFVCLIKTGLREETNLPVLLPKCGSTKNLFWADGSGAVYFRSAINVGESLRQIVARKLEIDDGIQINGGCIARVFPLGNEIVADYLARLNFIEINIDRNNLGVMQHDGCSLPIIEIVFFGLKGAGADNKKRGCYSGIYGYGYERTYAPCSVLLFVFVAFGLGGLVLTYEGFKRFDRKGIILVTHGWLSFIISLVAVTWLIAGDHRSAAPIHTAVGCPGPDILFYGPKYSPNKLIRAHLELL